MSNRNPTKKVLKSARTPVFVSEKFHTKKLIRTISERIKNKPMKALSNEKRAGNSVNDIFIILI